MYDKSDPRAALAPATTSAPVYTSYTPADYIRFYETPPQESGTWGRTWMTRGENAVVAYSEVEAGTRFERKGQVDEWVLLLPDAAMKATVTAGAETETVAGYTVTFVPPGDSTVTVETKGRVVRLFTTRSADLAARCGNAEAHATRSENVPTFQAWPVPPDGYRIRSYTLDVPNEPGRFGRIWRCTTFMVNYLATARRTARHHQVVAASSRRFRAILPRRAGLLHPPHALALDAEHEDVAAGRAGVLRHPVRRGDPAAGHPHDPRHGPGHQSARRHLLAAAHRFFTQGRLGAQRGRLPDGGLTERRNLARATSGRSTVAAEAA